MKKIGISAAVLGPVGLVGIIGGGACLGVSCNKIYEVSYPYSYRSSENLQIYQRFDNAIIKGLSEVKIDLRGSTNVSSWSVNGKTVTPKQITYDSFAFDTNDPAWVVGKNVLSATDGKQTSTLNIDVYDTSSIKARMVLEKNSIETTNYQVEQNSTALLKTIFAVNDKEAFLTDNNYIWETKDNTPGAQWTPIDPASIPAGNQLQLETTTLGTKYYRCKLGNTNIITNEIKVDIVTKTSTLESCFINITNKNSTNNKIFFVDKPLTFSATTIPAGPIPNLKYQWTINWWDDDGKKSFTSNQPTFDFTPKTSGYHNVSLIVEDGNNIVKTINSFETYKDITNNTQFDSNIYLSSKAGNQTVVQYTSNQFYVVNNADNSLSVYINITPDIYNGITQESKLFKYENNQWTEIPNSNSNSLSIPNEKITQGQNKFKIETTVTDGQQINKKIVKEFNVNIVGSEAEIPNFIFKYGIGSSNYGQTWLNGEKNENYATHLKYYKINSYNDFAKSDWLRKNSQGAYNNEMKKLEDAISSNYAAYNAGIALLVIFGVIGIAGLVLLILWIINRKK